MNPILLDFGFVQIRWYSVLVLIAFIIGYSFVIKDCKKNGYSLTMISDMCFYLVIFCILGARLYYCLFYVNELGINPYLTDSISIVKIWEGGLAIHGGVIAGFVFLLIYTKKKKLNLLELLDILAPALALGQAIGRWGNFFNSEAFGAEVSLSTLKSLPIPNFVINGMYINGAYHHPTFYYESVGCLIIFIILILLKLSKKLKNGQIVGIYFVLYSSLRFFIESTRTDSLMLFNLKIAQVISILLIIIGLYLIIRPYIRSKNDKQEVGHSIKK